MELLKFQPFVSVLDPGFWGRFANDKLITYRLDDSSLPLTLSYSNALHPSIPPRLCGYAEYSFKVTHNLGPLTVSSPSSLINFNTLDEFKVANKADLLHNEATRIWQDMLSLKALQDPSLLTRSLLISYADLKHWSFTSWLAAPALTVPDANILASPLTPLPYKHEDNAAANFPGAAELSSLLSAFLAARNHVLPPCMLYDHQTHSIVAYSSLPLLLTQTRGDAPAFSLIIVDPSSGAAPGWPARNIILYTALLMAAFGSKDISDAETQENSQVDVNIPILFLRDVQKMLSHATQPIIPASMTEAATLHQNHDNAHKSVSDVTIDLAKSTNNDSGSAVADITTSLPDIDDNTSHHKKAMQFTSISVTTAATMTFNRAQIASAIAYIQCSISELASPLPDIAYSPSVPSTQGFTDNQQYTEPHKHACDPAAPPMPAAPAATGWERVDNKLRPRVASLESVLDAKEVARRGVMLNLQLMKWRMLPELDLEKIGQTKCLLLGAGTLGCNVARLLLGWGHSHITMLDSGTVAPSNPVRQNLYTTADVGKPKAEAACAALRNIHPHVTATPIVMSIPMPGHHTSAILPANAAQRQELLLSVQRLAKVIAEHDVVFLLMDSRESRWLPAFLAAAYGIPCINAALGFDSYVVMRHGHRGHAKKERTPKKSENPEESGENSDKSDSLEEYCTPAPHLSIDLPPIPTLPLPPTLSCYFCIDITAPGNSFKQRTLDQQCTVTRPGLAYVSSGLAVEMAVAMLHAKQGARAHAVIDKEERKKLAEKARELYNKKKDVIPDDDDFSDVVAKSGKDSSDLCLQCGEACGDMCGDECGGLGGMPHQIRGSFYESEQVLMRGTAQPYCCCCGNPVQRVFREEGLLFLENALCVDGYLEEISGLAELVRGADDREWEHDDFDEEDF